MIKILRDDWVVLFNKKNLILSNTSVANIFCDSKTIIDDTLICSNHITTLLHCSFCVAKVFTKFRLPFKLSKCHFFLYRIKYVGHDLIADGNCPTQSKIQLIEEWSLPPHGVFFLSLTDLCSFIDIMFFYGLNPTLNFFVIFNICIIVKVYHSLLGLLR